MADADHVTHAWAANMSPHVSPPPAQSATHQAPASSTTHGSTTKAAGSAAAQTAEPTEEEEPTGLVVHITVGKVTATTGAAEEPAPPSNSPPGRRFLANRRRVYKLRNLDDGRQTLTRRDGCVPECHDPALVYNEVLHIHWRDCPELRIHVHVRDDGRTVILRALTPDEQAVWEDILRANQGIEPRLIALGETRLEPWGS